MLISFYVASSSGQDEAIDAPVSANPPHGGDIVKVSSHGRRLGVRTRRRLPTAVDSAARCVTGAEVQGSEHDHT